MANYFSGKEFGLSAQELNRKISVVIALGDVMTMLIFSAETTQDKTAFLNDWRRITAFYSKL